MLSRATAGGLTQLMRSDSGERGRFHRALRESSGVDLVRRARNVLRAAPQKALVGYAAALVRRRTSGRVSSGLFAGMVFTEQAVFGAPFAKLLGTYEMELSSQLDDICRRMTGCLLNIGGAEGYYAIGCALLRPSLRVVVFEMQAAGRKIISEIACKNGVSERVDLRAECTEQQLNETLLGEACDLLLMDVEGAELSLLSDRVVAGLRSSFVIVESHDFAIPGCAAELTKRLLPTHSVEVIDSRSRTERDFPLDCLLPASAKLALMDEGRPGPMQWIVARPRPVGA